MQVCSYQDGCMSFTLLTYHEGTTEKSEVLPSVISSTAFDAVLLRVAPIFGHRCLQAPLGLEQPHLQLLPDASLHNVTRCQRWLLYRAASSRAA